MIKLMISIITTLIVGANIASACTVGAVDKEEQVQDLTAQALTHLNISSENVTEVVVKDYYGHYIWTTMCPKGLESGAKLFISFNNVNDPLTKGCLAIIQVDKKFIYKDELPIYGFNMIQDGMCAEAVQ